MTPMMMQLNRVFGCSGPSVFVAALIVACSSEPGTTPAIDASVADVTIDAATQEVAADAAPSQDAASDARDASVDAYRSECNLGRPFSPQKEVGHLTWRSLNQTCDACGDFFFVRPVGLSTDERPPFNDCITYEPNLFMGCCRRECAPSSIVQCLPGSTGYRCPVGLTPPATCQPAGVADSRFLDVAVCCPL